MSAVQIAEMWRTDPSWVRKVIHDFNERGMASLRSRYRGGRPRRITTDQRQQIISVAGSRLDHQGVPLTRWSLPRLSIYLTDHGIVEVSPRHLGVLLAEAGLSFERTRTWQASPDPDYEQKDRTDPRTVRAAATRRGGGQLRPDGSGQPAPDPWSGLGTQR
jgi:transposase